MCALLRKTAAATTASAVVLTGALTFAAGDLEAQQEPLVAVGTVQSSVVPGTQAGGGQNIQPSEDVTQPGTLFPVWSLRSTRQIDPRLRPNLGKRVPLAYYPIAGGPLLYPAFSPVTPDFLGGQVTRPWSLRVSAALLGVDGERDSAKLQEFRDLQDGATAGLEAHYRQGNTLFNVVGRQLGRDDQDLRMDGGWAGTLQWSALYDETPHRYAFGAKSLYGGIGTTHLTILDAIQADLQNSTSNANLAAKVGAYVDQQAIAIDEQHRRQQAGAEVVLVATYPFVAKASFSNESRDGVRPFSGSFGFGNFVEIPWPVQYDTRDMRLSGEWAKPEARFYASGAYRFSDFVNHVESFLFDNPFRILDSAVVAGTFNGGPVMGRMTLYPSNQYHEASGSFAIKQLPLHSTVNALVSFGFMRQNEPLVPFSTNTVNTLSSPVSASFNATDPAGLPRSTAESAMNTQTVHMRWTGRPSSQLHVTGQYRLNKLDNHQEPFTFFMFVREDQDVRRPVTPGDTFRTVPLEYAKHTFTGEASYRLPADSNLNVTYTFDRMNRDFREVAWMNDHKIKVALDSRRFGMVELKSWYERANRSTADYLFNQYNEVQGNPLAHPMLPYLRKFDETAYHRNEGQGMVTAYLSDSTNVSAHAQYVGTDYIKSPAGVLWDRRHSYGVDFMYAPTPRLNFFADTGLERLRSQLAARQWGVPGPVITVSDPYLRETGLESNSNWTARASDEFVSTGFGFDADLMEQRLNLNVYYNFSESDGLHSYTSPVGIAANDVNPFEPQPFNNVDDVRWHTLTAELEYQHNQAVSLSLGYNYEKWDIEDYNYPGFSYTPFFTNGVAVLMGGLLPPAYKTNVVYLRVKVGL